MSRHGLPVLRAGDVEKSVKQPLFDAGIKHVHEFLPDVWLGAAQTCQKGWLQLGGELTAT